MSDAVYLLIKRGLYYAPDKQGYTGIKDRAGRYHEHEARPKDGVTAVHENRAPFFAPGFSAACIREFMRDFAERVPDLDRRCVAIADMTVPEYHNLKGRTCSRSGTVARRWQAAYDGARLAFTNNAPAGARP